MTQMKLSEIWDKADKELTQTKRTFGSGRTKTACALGAIAYYANDYPWYSQEGLLEFERKFGNITLLNDVAGWTFKQFADAARAIGE